MRIELQDIHKYYGPVRANNGISLTVAPGEIHGILGENGAGKSTLMKILTGFIHATQGSILINASPVKFQNPAQSSQLGIGMLYQDPLDFPLMTVLDNFMLGLTDGLSVETDQFRDKLKELATSFGFQINPDIPVQRLTIGERQQLEIVRLLVLGIEVLVLDEPTTGISEVQKRLLFQALKKLAADGKSVILVSHKLEDVETLCDRVTVLRYGAVTGAMESPFDTEELLKMMFGAPPAQPLRKAAQLGASVLEMKQVYASGGRAGLEDCNLTFREGEMIGLAGLEGSGQGVFLRVASGVQKPSLGEITLRGSRIKGGDYSAFKYAGTAFLPASRLEEGLIPGLTMTEHYALQNKNSKFLIPWTQAYQQAKERIKLFRIKGKPQTFAHALSGGNQQRLLLSFLPDKPKLLLLENPTRGLDLESAHWVWQRLCNYADQKVCIVFASSELDEILMVADRILVFFDGRIIKDVKSDETDADELGRAIAGKSD
ncbi:ATP-binding cassette domain-containing protein [Desulfococcaceae bacterium HSG9]|nr:ATP-binding cassette domain-containing protein [Desulfococcaceae bacterium HSG9]